MMTSLAKTGHRRSIGLPLLGLKRKKDIDNYYIAALGRIYSPCDHHVP